MHPIQIAMGIPHLGFMTDFYDVSLGIVTVLLLVALHWSVTLRRKVREQSEQIRQQLRREVALEEKYHDLFENANDMVFRHDMPGKLTSLNKAGERILGCARERSLRMSLREFVAPGHTEVFDRWWEKCAAGVTPSTLELEVVGCNDIHSILEISARLTRESKQTTGIEAIARDITEKKRAEEALRQSEERFSSAFRVSPVAIGISSLSEWRFIDVNESFLRLFGYQRDEVIQHTAAELGLWANTEDRARLEKLLREIQSLGGVECKFRVKSGGLRATLLFAERINIGETPCALVIVHDITDRLNLEAQLRQALKMEAIGRLAAGVAHDFNNLLTIITCNTDLVQRDKSLAATTQAELDRISDASQRAANLTRQLLTFSRQQAIQRRLLNLNEVINNGLKMYKHLLRDDIALRLKFSPHLPMVNADQTMIDQVTMNLVVNARDAMPKGGDLIIETAPQEILAAYVQNHPEAAAGHYVCLSVTDTGCGMDAATQSRVFEPFFTTKEPGKGTGLGLATTYGIVKQHQGWIELTSEPGCGACFKILLPAEKQTGIVNKSSSLSSSTNKITILAVEAETALAEMLQKVLEAQDYRVLEASDSLAALQVWSDHRGQIDLLMTDVKLRGMSGIELAANLRALKSDLKVLFISGSNQDTATPELLSQPNTALLSKPYSTADLVQAVHLSLEKPA